MHSRAFAARIGRGPVLVVFLAPAVVLGFALGTWLGQHGPGAQAGVAEPTASAAVSPVPIVSAASPASTPSPPSTSSADTPEPTQKLILAIDGSENMTSEPFTVKEGWQIQWQTDGSAFSFGLSGDQDIGTVIDEPGPASGVTSVPVGGTFKLEVKAKGPWKITVRQPPT